MIFDPIEQGTHYKKMWGDIWSEFKDEYQQMLRSIGQLRVWASDSEPLEPITKDMVREGAKLFNNKTGLGCDL